MNTNRIEHRLMIRFVNPDHTPARYGAQGFGIGVSVIMDGDHWILRGPLDLLEGYLARVAQAGDVGDYYWKVTRLPLPTPRRSL